MGKRHALINNNFALAAVAIMLGVAVVWSVSRPLSFAKKMEEREREVKQRLAEIRAAEENYRRAAGCYTANLDTLVTLKLLKEGRQMIPGGNGRRFQTVVGMVKMQSGRIVPIMECGARYDEYLAGLDVHEIAAQVERADAEARYPGLKIGDLTQPNDNKGNWE
ncbi:hypothetical protein [Prevotella sp. OH937_COT-195]|uniref:hypothetical protein n=1 Tax=Prevotella sp. OH937_COT-195 TaxID=2491051 RepID=UPI000F64B6E4|nr:hypothetical protein [Prevotella sp. OH937_COT-195]RRD02645.1 hypothetical protein EII32_01110 [Prevotella sp. OH937_COT-195]